MDAYRFELLEAKGMLDYLGCDPPPDWEIWHMRAEEILGSEEHW